MINNGSVRDNPSHVPESLSYANADHPCEVCGRTRSCNRGDGGLIMCFGESGEVPGYTRIGPAHGKPEFTLYRRIGDDGGPAAGTSTRAPTRARPAKPKAPPMDPAACLRQATYFARDLTDQAVAELSAVLGIPARTLRLVPLLGYGWDFDREGNKDTYWTFPEFTAGQEVCGIMRRFHRCESDRHRPGDKWQVRGSVRGLSKVAYWRDRAGPLLIPAGMSDTLGLAAGGLKAVGRPSDLDGLTFAAELVRGRPADERVIVLGENDERFNRKTGCQEWPGRDGARDFAAKLAGLTGRPVEWALPPAGFKDARAWFNAHVPADAPEDEWEAAGREFLAHVEADAGRQAAELSEALADLGVAVEPVSEPARDPSPPTAPPVAPAADAPLIPRGEERSFHEQLADLMARYPDAPRRCHCERIQMADGRGFGALGFYADGGWSCCCGCNLRNKIQKKEYYRELMEWLTTAAETTGNPQLGLEDGVWWVRRRPHAPDWYTPKPRKPKGPRIASRQTRPERRDRLWERMRGEITRNAAALDLKPNCVRVFVQGATQEVIVSTVRFTGAEPMGPAAAYAALADAIDGIPPDARSYRPISASRAVIVDRDETGEGFDRLPGMEQPRLKDHKSGWSIVGKSTRCTDLQAMEEARAEGGELVTSFDAEVTGPAEPDSNLRRFLKWRLPTTGVYASLSAQERAQLFFARMNVRLNGFDPDRYCRSADAIVPSGNCLSIEDVLAFVTEVACSP